MAQSESQASPGFLVPVLEHVQPPKIVLVHYHVTDRKKPHIIDCPTGTLDDINQLPTQLQSIRFEIYLEENVRYSKNCQLLAS